ncbi:MAG: STAS domain-containing protein [Rhodanobacter sp.]|nr:STAS domain-containing protein [Rhodanobacter sp.]
MTSISKPEFQLDTSSADALAVSGVLSFDTAAAALLAIRAALATGRRARLDLSRVRQSDSAGLACVLASVAEASRRGQPLQVAHMPAGMLALARVCGVDELMP